MDNPDCLEEIRLLLMNHSTPLFKKDGMVQSKINSIEKYLFKILLNKKAS
jgi:hypothetical protein